MRRIGIVLLLLIAVAMPFISGCGAKNVYVKLPELTPAAAAAAGELVAEGYFKIKLLNVHVHDVNEGFIDVPLANEVTIDLVKWLEGNEYVVCSANLAPGVYSDLAFTIGSLAWDCNVSGNWTDSESDDSYNIALNANGSLDLSPGLPISTDFFKIGELYVYEDGAAEWVWSFNLGIMSSTGSLDGSFGFGATVSHPLN